MPTSAFAVPQAMPRHRANDAQPAPPLRVVRGGRYALRKARQTAQRVGAVLAAVVILTMVVAVVYSQAQVTRLSSEIDAAKQELTNAQSTYDYLSAQMSAITSNANVQQIAEGKLGLVKADNSQVTYIRLQEQTTVERAQNRAAALFSDFGTAVLSLLDSLAP